ncbi:MAG: type II secretion system F family protein [Candidatus Woesearchaeota archaeon]
MIKPINKDRFNQKKFKEEILSTQSSAFIFKEPTTFKNFKERINSALNKHFNQKAFEKSQKEHTAQNSRDRFDRSAKKKKKLIGLFAEFALKLGFDSTARDINKKVLRFVTLLCVFLSLVVTGFVIFNNKPLDILVTFLLFIWTLIFAVAYLLGALTIFVYLDLRMHQHVRQIEESLPDFLQLASANISAGMTIDRALWYAIRPKFGILATEMEDVAKATIAGEDLEKALVRMGKKYNSRILKETINLVVEGIQSGGEMANLLSKLSGNIKETQLMRKEISASVTTYAIFIGAATIVAAPLLFALSTQLLAIIQNIFSSIHIDSSTGYSSMFSFNFSGDSIKLSDFRKFALLVLVISSFFSAAIISVIRKGSVKDGLKLIPIFAIVSIVLYFLASSLFKSLMSGLF